MADLWLPPKPAIILQGRLSGAEFAWIYPAAGRYRAAGGGSPATRTYVSSTVSTSNASAYTFTNHNIGTAAADRYVVVGYASYNNTSGAPSFSSATIGGNAATPHHNQINVTDFVYMATGIFGLLVTSGTQATIVVNFSETMQNCVVSVWALYGLDSTTPHHTNGGNADSATSVSTTLNIPDQGVAVAIAGSVNNNVAHTAAGLTEDADTTIESTQRYHSMSAQSMSAETGRTISSTGNAVTFRSLAAASWV
jgi:hypothetical protein